MTDAGQGDGAQSPLRVEMVGSVCRLLLNRPESLNAVDGSLHRALAAVWDELDTEAVRAVVLTGAGRAFSAGGDLAHMTLLQDDPAARRQDMRQAARIVRGMTRFPAPIVAAVNGPAVGLGASLVALADLVLIAENAYVADPHVSVGLTAADGGISLWPWLVGLHRAKEYLLTGDRISAQTAVEIGLANRAVPAAQLAEQAMALAQRLAAQPRRAVETTKQGLNMHLADALDRILDAGLAAEEQCFDDHDHRRAVASLRDR